MTGVGIVPPMVADDAAFRVERVAGTIVLIGEIDAYTEAQVRDALTCAQDSGDLRVDVSRVTFIDSSGLRVMLGVHQQLIREGNRLVLVAPSRTVTRLIKVAGLVSHFQVEPQPDPADAPQRVAGADR
jgi:anti-anti-sigma factor